MAASKKKRKSNTGAKNAGRKVAAGNAQSKTPAKKPEPKGKERVQEEETSHTEEVVLLLLIGLSLILELSNFGLCGVIGEFLSQFMFGMFGIVSYGIPIYLFIGAAFLIANHYQPRAVKKVVYMGIVLLTVGIFVQMLSGTDVQSVFEFYGTAAKDKTGGGLLGGTLAYLLIKGLGTIGGYLVVLLITVIFVMLITEVSFLALFQLDLEDDEDDDEEEEYEDSRAYRETREVRANNEEKKRTRRRTKQREENDDPFHRKKNEQEEPQKKDIGEALRISPDRGDSSLLSHPVIEEDVHEITMSLSGVDDADDDDMTTEIQVETPTVKKRRVGRTKQSKAETETATKEVEKEIATKEIEEERADMAGDDYKFPPVSLLKRGKGGRSGNFESSVRETAMKLQQTLKNFGVNVTITDYSCGPAVTRYEMQPEQGVKVSKIVSLADDIKLNLAAADIRIEAPIPGKAAVGIEVPNKENSVVCFRDLVESDAFAHASSKMSFAVGKDIGGQVVVTDIAKMPHLLIAGATGSGKSVCINTLIMSILYKAHPDDVKLIMIDPKMVELSVYNGIPHLLVPVVTDPKKAAGALNWAVIEMTNRYQLFAEYNVRNLKGYNKKIEEVIATGEADPENMPKKMPQIVVIVDELADLMMVAHGEVEDAIVRLSQLARAAGIHLVIATQRPSVDVITGLIKANVPSRIAFAVSSGVDSRTILDMVGAEKLLGKGDMLFYPTGYPKPVRVQGAFVTDEEVAAVTDYIKKQKADVTYDSNISSQMESAGVQGTQSGAAGKADDRDEYFIEAGKYIIEKDKASIGLLQRVYKIGFNRAARIMDQLYEAGVVGPEEGTKPRKVLMSLEEFEQYVEEYV